MGSYVQFLEVPVCFIKLDLERFLEHENGLLYLINLNLRKYIDLHIYFLAYWWWSRDNNNLGGSVILQDPDTIGFGYNRDPADWWFQHELLDVFET